MRMTLGFVGGGTSAAGVHPARTRRMRQIRIVVSWTGEALLSVVVLPRPIITPGRGCGAGAPKTDDPTRRSWRPAEREARPPPWSDYFFFAAGLAAFFAVAF